jgi:tetratricopeptide (TPR) repeat protein
MRFLTGMRKKLNNNYHRNAGQPAFLLNTSVMFKAIRVGVNRMKIAVFLFLYVFATAIYLPFPILTGKEQLMQPGLLILFSFFNLFTLFKKPPHQLSLFETIAFGYLVYILLRSIFHSFNADSIERLLLLPVLYFSCKDLVQNEKAGTGFIIIAPAIVLALVVIAHALNNPLNSSAKGLFLPNKSILSIHISTLASFLCFFLFNPGNNNKLSPVYRLLLAILLILILPVLLWTEGRAGWIGLLTALVYIARKQLTLLRKPYFKVTAVIVLATVMCSLFFFKADSSKGRLLIYKVSCNILSNNSLLGIGNGQFKQEYNLYQAEYFSSHDINNKEALLADDSYYAFNDYFQFMIENGLTGFVLMSVSVYLLIREIRKKDYPQVHLLSFAAQVSLICMATSALFSYPFQNLPILVHTVLCMAIIHSSLPPGKIQLSFITARFIIPSFSTLLLAISICILYSKARVDKGNSLSSEGFHKEAIKYYSSSLIESFDDGSGLYNYARELYYINQPLKARQILDRAMQLYSSSELFLLSGKIDIALNNYPAAEKSYRTAIYMVPAKMRTRYELFRFYLDTGDTSKAAFWKKSILNMPVKVPSPTTAQILNNTKDR